MRTVLPGVLPPAWHFRILLAVAISFVAGFGLGVLVAEGAGWPERPSGPRPMIRSRRPASSNVLERKTMEVEIAGNSCGLRVRVRVARS